MKFRSVLFDLDGTLADTAPDLGLALNMQRARYGLPALPLETIRPHASHGSRGLLGIGFGITPEHDDFVARREEYLAVYDDVFCRQPALFAGMPVLLDRIENQGMTWGIVTNKPRRFTQPLIKALGLSGRASCVISGDDCPRPKPYPDTLLLACQQSNTLPDQCVYVGDAERDVIAGLAAGMVTVIARYGYLDTHDHPETWGAQGMIDAPLELLELL